MLKTCVPVLLLALGGPAPAAAAVVQELLDLPAPEPVREAVRTRFEAPDVLVAAGQVLYATTALPMFYERRAYTPVWVQDGAPTQAARRLVREIARSDAEGLQPEDYHLATIRRLIREAEAGAGGATTVAADLELLLSDAFLVLGSHYLSGRVDPATIHTEWVANRRNTDLTVVLDEAVTSGEPGLALQALLPAQPGYARLREALTRYRTIEARGGWPTIEAGASLRIGDEGLRVSQLQARLVAGADMAPGADSAGVFGAATEAAVREVQRRHGLDIDGVVGAGTLAALNEPVQTRIRQVVLNMERWRWLPQELGSRHVLVNIANFELDVVEDGREVMTMRVAVGRPYRKTPVFSDRMTHLVLSPYWHVPTNLAVQDKLPEIRRQGTDWFARNNMRVFQGWGSAQRAVDPASVDWSRLGAGNFPYHLRQDPGPSNALGRVKFMFPNRFNVYLHDTPGREIFGRTERAFSSGCIRIEQPVELALYLIGGQGWTRESIQAVVNARVERTVNLAEPVPVHLLYWTAWADPQGTLNFRRDIYDRDTHLAAALAEPPPRVGR